MRCAMKLLALAEQTISVYCCDLLLRVDVEMVLVVDSVASLISNERNALKIEMNDYCCLVNLKRS